MTSDRPRLALVPEDAVIAVDRLTFLVPARRFQVEGTLLRSGYVSLATEFALRLLRDAEVLSPGELGAFLGFSDGETRTLVQELLLDGYLDVDGDRIRLAQKGERAFDPASGELKLLEIEPFSDTVTLDLLSFAPVEVPGTVRLPWLVELELPDKDRAAAASREGTRGFRANFGEWRDGKYRGERASGMRLHTLSGDVVPLARSSVPITIPMTYAPSQSDGIDADFSALRDRGRRDARKELVEALSDAIKRIVAPGDHAEGAATTARWDGGVLVGSAGSPTVSPLLWLQIASRTPPAALPDMLAPSVRLAGSAISPGVLSVLSHFLDGVAGPGSEDVPVLWVPAAHPAWGASGDLLDVTRRIKSGLSPKAGIVLLPRSDNDDRSKRNLVRAYGGGRDGKQTPLFDACVVIPPHSLPLSLEVILQPGFWAVVLLHVPSKDGFPVPMGYATRNVGIVDAVASLLGEVVTKLHEPSVAWSARDTRADAVLDGLERHLTG
ncbi:hypothetical protein [Methylobacterium sp. WL116]|uniref:hypothetical protein n=1 Tax=Methylobacterium sp. WL116 TaxID=2603889 RepID=UPI0011CA0152|nr:hypothetical protein [Methylobacterium sp. WL116]TXM95225.1 hypothetical protein FV223_01635 [Methylobacterium sp. WL116]